MKQQSMLMPPNLSNGLLYLDSLQQIDHVVLWLKDFY